MPTGLTRGNFSRSKSTTISYPSATYPCAWRSASWALRPGRNQKFDPENVGSRMGSRTCVIACCTSRSTVPGLDPGIWMPSWRSPPPGLGIETPRRACPREGGGLWFVATVQQAYDQSFAVRSNPVTQGFDGHPIHTRRATVPLYPLVGPVQVRGAAHRFHQVSR